MPAHSPPEPSVDPPDPGWRRAGEVGTIGVEMVVAVVACGAAGMWADTRWQLAPWGTLSGLCIGFGAAVRSVMRLVRRFKPPASTETGPSTKPPEQR